MKYDSLGDYIGAVLDHINDEYEGSGLYGDLTVEEKNMIFQKLTYCYNNDDSVSNAGSDIVSYVRNNRNQL